MQWLQHPTQSSVNNINNVRHKAITYKEQKEGISESYNGLT
jgi:hypothetical protein